MGCPEASEMPEGGCCRSTLGTGDLHLPTSSLFTFPSEDGSVVEMEHISWVCALMDRDL